MALVRSTITGVETDGRSSSQNIILNVDDLSKVRLSDLDRASAVRFVRKGASSHVEVICRTRGIPLLQTDVLDFAEGAEVTIERDLYLDDDLLASWRSHSGGIQASVYAPDDLLALRGLPIATVFVRMEHLLYRIAALHPGSVRGNPHIARLLAEQLREFETNLPSGSRLLVRGLDVRSDDPVLAHEFFDSAEANPELGDHGTRRALHDPDWVGIESASLASLSAPYFYAPSFITRYVEYQQFVGAYADLFPRAILVPFAETPAVFHDVARYGSDLLCIGLKDVAQFYFAADRGSTSVASSSDLLDAEFLAAVRRTADAAPGTLLSIYQSLETFASYARALDGVRWMPSLAAGDLALLSEALKDAS